MKKTSEFENKIILVTGSSRGIGAHLVKEFAKLGAKVVITFSSSKREAVNLIKESSLTDDDYLLVKVDVSSRRQVEKMVHKIIRKFGRLDILINNAAILKMPANWNEVSERDFENTLLVNLKGAFECTRRVGQQMLEQGGGNILNISTIGGGADVVAYITSKNGVNSLTKSFASGLAPKVRVNGVALSLINAGMGKVEDLRQVSGYIKETPLKRLGTLEDVFGAVSFLVSEKSSFVTGQTIVVDGGRSL